MQSQFPPLIMCPEHNEPIKGVCFYSQCSQRLLCRQCRQHHDSQHLNSYEGLDDLVRGVIVRDIYNSLNGILKTVNHKKMTLEGANKTIENNLSALFQKIQTYIMQKMEETYSMVLENNQNKIIELEDTKQDLTHCMGLVQDSYVKACESQFQPANSVVYNLVYTLLEAQTYRDVQTNKIRTSIDVDSIQSNFSAPMIDGFFGHFQRSLDQVFGDLNNNFIPPPPEIMGNENQFQPQGGNKLFQPLSTFEGGFRPQKVGSLFKGSVQPPGRSTTSGPQRGRNMQPNIPSGPRTLNQQFLKRHPQGYEQQPEESGQIVPEEEQGQMQIEPTQEEQRKEGTLSKPKNSAKKILNLFEKVDKGEKASLARSGTESQHKHGHKRTGSLQERLDSRKNTPSQRSSSAHQLSRSSKMIIKGETRQTDVSSITFGGMAYISSKNQLVVGGNEGDLEFCDLQGDKRPQKVRKAHAGEIFRVFYLEERNLVFSAGLGGVVNVWHHNNTRQLWEQAGRFEKHAKTVFALGYLPVSKMMVSGGEDEHIRVWRFDPKIEEAYSLKTSRLNIGSLCGFKRNGKEVVAAGFDKGHINMIEIQAHKREKLCTIKAKGYILNLSYFEERDLLFSASDSCEIRMFKLGDKGKAETLMTFETESPIKNFAVFLDKDLLVSNEENRRLTLWDLKTANLIKHYEDRSCGGGLATIKGKGKIATGSRREVRLWDIN